jgi:hypothetical protein
VIEGASDDGYPPVTPLLFGDRPWPPGLGATDMQLGSLIDPGGNASGVLQLRYVPRLALRSATERGGFVDGGWWPRSLDLAMELPDVLLALFASGYVVHRVTYNLVGWQQPPPTIAVAGRRISLGGVRNQSRSSITLVDTANTNSPTVNRLNLVVVPPDSDPWVADRALRMAGQDGLRLRPSEILVQARSGS